MGPTALEDVANLPPQRHKGRGMDEDIVDELENPGEAGNSLITLAAPPVTAGNEAHGSHFVVETPLRQLLALGRKQDLVVAVQEGVQLGEPPGVLPHALEDNIRQWKRMNGPLVVRVDGPVVRHQ